MRSASSGEFEAIDIQRMQAGFIRLIDDCSNAVSKAVINAAYSYVGDSGNSKPPCPVVRR